MPIPNATSAFSVISPASYERMGELRADPRQPNKNDAAAAVNAYRQGVKFRKEIAARSDAIPADRRDLALSLSKLADGQFLAGEYKEALANTAKRTGWRNPCCARIPMTPPWLAP